MSLVMLVVTLLSVGQPLQAQDRLVESFPAPNATLNDAPQEVMLTFSDRIRPYGIEVTLVDNQQQIPVELSTPLIGNGRTLRYEIIGEVYPGEYTVAYRVIPVGRANDIRGVFLFEFQPPRPRLIVQSPVDGQAFDTGTILVNVETMFFDLAQGDRAISIKVDQEPFVDVDTRDYIIEGLSPGVHEIEIALTIDGDPVPGTERTLTVAVKQALDEPAAELPPASPWQLILGGVLSIILLGLGVMLGRSTTEL